MSIIRKAKQTDYPRIMQIWESSVRATHDFLKEEDALLFKRLIPSDFLPQLDVFIIEDNGLIPAYFAVSKDNLEMLFVDAETRGKGYGKQAVEYVLNHLQVYKVDVNDQNPQATGFYQKLGYRQTGRSEKDGTGKPYPLLHLECVSYKSESIKSL